MWGPTLSLSPMVSVHARQKSRWTALRRKVLAGTPSRTTELVKGRTRTDASTGAQARRSVRAVRTSIAGEYRVDRISIRDAYVWRAVDNDSRRGLVVTLEKLSSRSGRFRCFRCAIFWQALHHFLRRTSSHASSEAASVGVGLALEHEEGCARASQILRPRRGGEPHRRRADRPEAVGRRGEVRPLGTANEPNPYFFASPSNEADSRPHPSFAA